MKEFNLHSADKYKDGSPMMSDLSVQFVRLLKRIEILDETQDDIVEKYDAVLKIHGDTLEKHKERITNNEGDTNAISYDVENLQIKVTAIEQRIDKLTEDYDTALAKYASKFKGKINNHTDALLDHEHKLSTLSEDVSINEGNIESLCSDVEDLQRKIYQIYQFLNSVDPDFFAKVQDETTHRGSNFCGNCAHSKLKDGIFICELSDEAIDPDSASCSMFEPPF